MELKWLDKIKDAIFPQRCISCQRDGFLLCVECRAVFICRNIQHCPGCSAVTAFGARCIEHYDHVLDGVVSATWYANPLSKKLITMWKYRYVQDAQEHVSFILVRWLQLNQQIPTADWVVVPVPMHDIRCRERGFDQSLILSQVISMELGIDLRTDLVRRKKHFYKPQAELDDTRRSSRSFSGVFEVNTKIIVPKNVVLVDDVYTTGKTMSAVALELKLAGVETVWGMTFARGN